MMMAHLSLMGVETYSRVLFTLALSIRIISAETVGKC